MNKLKTAVMMQKMDTESLRQKSIVQRIEIVEGHKILVDTTLHKIVSGVIKPLWVFTTADKITPIRIFDTYINCACNKTNPLAYFEYSKHNSKSVITAITDMSIHVNADSKHGEFSKYAKGFVLLHAQLMYVSNILIGVILSAVVNTHSGFITPLTILCKVVSTRILCPSTISIL